MQNPTTEQRDFAAELLSGTSSINLNAVAGSGKTTTLVYAANMLKPTAGQVMALAFNKKIAMELEKKLPGAIDCMTLNSLGHRAWQQRLGRRLTLNDRKVGEICSKLCKEHDIGDSWKSLKDMVIKAKDAGLVPDSGITKGMFPILPDTQESWYDIIPAHSIEGGEDLIPIARKALIESIGEALRGTIDFGDQLYMTCITKAKLPQYELVLVDEAQDLSEIQHELISRCVKPGGRLIAVGDPKQAIYGFRGAHSQSMEILAARFGSKEMGLTCTFRCPKAIVELARRIVPQIHCLESAEEGEIFRPKNWTPSDLKEGSAVVCRNIAPLVKLGFACFRENVSCWVVGRDIGAPLIKAAKELNGTSPAELNASIANWLAQKSAIANGNLELISRAQDTAEALYFVVSSSNARHNGEVVEQLQRLFSKEGGSITLSTIHRAKGLEWDIVYFLDSWRVPAKFAQRAADNDPQGCAWMLEQEENLRYIAVTRAKKELHFINYEQG